MALSCQLTGDFCTMWTREPQKGFIKCLGWVKTVYELSLSRKSSREDFWVDKKMPWVSLRTYSLEILCRVSKCTKWPPSWILKFMKYKLQLIEERKISSQLKPLRLILLEEKFDLWLVYQKTKMAAKDHQKTKRI